MDNNGIRLTTIVVVEASHRAVLMVRCEHLGDLHHSTIQQMTILSCCVLPSCEKNAATIRTIDVDGVTSKLVLHHHVQAETKTDTAILY